MVFPIGQSPPIRNMVGQKYALLPLQFNDKNPLCAPSVCIVKNLNLIFCQDCTVNCIELHRRTLKYPDFFPLDPSPRMTVRKNIQPPSREQCVKDSLASPKAYFFDGESVGTTYITLEQRNFCHLLPILINIDRL